MATEFVWLAETVASPPRYLTRAAPGRPVMLTTDPTAARRFTSRDACIDGICAHAVRELIDEELVPREHGFG